MVQHTLTHEQLTELLYLLIDTAQAVVDNWEGPNLASAVHELEEAIFDTVAIVGPR